MSAACAVSADYVKANYLETEGHADWAALSRHANLVLQRLEQEHKAELNSAEGLI
jgi:hypothetical protein